MSVTKFSGPLPETTPLPKLVDKDRLTLTLNVHHEHHGEQPHSVSTTTWKTLETSEETFSKRVTVGEEWQLLIPDRCWLDTKDIGYIVIENLEGKNRLVQPTENERKVIEAKIVEVGWDGVGRLEITPGWPLLLPLVLASDATQIRCCEGEAVCRITVFPR